jgi:hypothetical protein
MPLGLGFGNQVFPDEPLVASANLGEFRRLF